MKITFFGTQPYDRDSFDRANAAFGFEFNYHRSHLNLNNVALAQDTDVVCIFVNDTADAETIDRLAAMGEADRIALRGFQQRGFECRGKAPHSGGARAGLFALCRGRICRSVDAGAQPQDPPRLLAYARR